jgi:hypothetical protein
MNSLLSRNVFKVILHVNQSLFSVIRKDLLKLLEWGKKFSVKKSNAWTKHKFYFYFFLYLCPALIKICSQDYSSREKGV